MLMHRQKRALELCTGACMGTPVQYLASHQIDAKRCSLFFSFLQVRVVALGCTADLFKSPDAQNYLSTHPDFLQVLVQCMRVRCNRF